MRYLFAVLFTIEMLFLGFQQTASAQATFNFISQGVEITPEGVTSRIFAVLELSGSSPYDHTNISSLTFTPAAGDRLGYVGPYAGEFDSSFNRTVENSDGVLTELAGEMAINFVLRDFDPPAFNAGPFSTETNSILTIQIIRGEDGLSLISTSRGAGSNAIGHWVRAIPEPSTLLLSLGTALIGLGGRTSLLSLSRRG